MAGGRRTEYLWPGLALGAVAAVWRWRLELGLLTLPAIAHELLVAPVGEPAAWIVVVLLVVAVVAVPALRRRMTRALVAARVRRRWRRAWIDCGLPRLRAGHVVSV